MTDPGIHRAIAAAEALERRGETDAAAAEYQRIGKIEEASQVMLNARRYSEAAGIILAALKLPVARMGELDPAGRKLALKASICLAQAGDLRQAATLQIAIGEYKRAADLLERQGDLLAATELRASGGKNKPSEPHLPAPQPDGPAIPAERARELERSGHLDLALRAYLELGQQGAAGRVLRKLGRLEDAAKLFLQIDMPYEAGVCLDELGDAHQALTQLARVPPEHRNYRDACLKAIRLAASTARIDFAVHHFLAAFAKTPPQSADEAEALYVLACAYERTEFPEHARDVFRKLQSALGAFRDVAERLARLDAEWAGSRELQERIRREDDAFHHTARKAPLAARPPPLLPDLPSLPDLPPLPVPTRLAAQAQRPAVSAPTVPSGDRPPTPQADHATRALTTPPAPQPPSGLPVAFDVLDLPAGFLIDDRYRVERKLGAGGMATVYQATDLELGEKVAIKLFALSMQDESLVTRFKQELLLARKVAHPNVVRLYDIGNFRGCKFMTMELMSGRDLGAILEQQGKLDLARGLHYLVQACAGLQAAHSMGVVHRDVKAGNFFVTHEDVLKVMDFGLAKRVSAKGVTVAGFIAGTPSCMAPEQIRDFASADHRADLYSLGVVAYEMFSGHNPFESASDMMGLLACHLSEPPPAPRGFNPAIPESLEAVILELLEKDPSRRIQSCQELIRRLRSVSA